MLLKISQPCATQGEKLLICAPLGSCPECPTYGAVGLRLSRRRAFVLYGSSEENLGISNQKLRSAQKYLVALAGDVREHWRCNQGLQSIETVEKDVFVFSPAESG